MWSTTRHTTWYGVRKDARQYLRMQNLGIEQINFFAKLAMSMNLRSRRWKWERTTFIY